MLSNFHDHYQLILVQLQREFEAYSDEEAIWNVLPGTTNSAGNLGMHLAGNLRHFFGCVFCEGDYTRNRENEFAGKLSKSDLLAELKMAETSVLDFLAKTEEADLLKKVSFRDEEKSLQWMLLQLLHHLTYHLGQINYHRRFMDQ